MRVYVCVSNYAETIGEKNKCKYISYKIAGNKIKFAFELQTTGVKKKVGETGSKRKKEQF